MPPRPNSEYLAFPSFISMPHTRSDHLKIALLELPQEVVGKKKQAAAHGGGLLRIQKKRYAL